MDVVALLSGGKDSCYTLYKCRQHGHRIVAIAHITPPHAGEPDSHMYQSVCSNLLPHIAEALQLPLHTRQTSAKARHTSLSYVPTHEDEVEDLVELLRDVKERHPTVGAVCAGALWSDYQRLRVENAAMRVGLLSIAYLWRREQSLLLDEMIEMGMHAVLVKVAGIGLTERHLGKSLGEMRGGLRELKERFGSHVCGEGGEFESLVLWMPGFGKRIVLDEVEVVRHSQDPVAPVAYLKVGRCHLEQLTEEQRELVVKPLPPPPKPFQGLDLHSKARVVSPVPSVQNEAMQKRALFEEVSVGKGLSFMHIVVRVPEQGREGVMRAAKRLKEMLAAHDESLACVVYVTLHLRQVSGAHYIDANKGYVEVFGVAECTPPPSRACVGAYENNHATILQALVRRNRNREESFTMHVQSLSEWAPPCIGPYAQLVEEGGVVHVCGVLPLYAPMAQVLEGMEIERQTEACLYNLRRTLEGGKGGFERLGVFVAYVVRPDLVDKVEDGIRRGVRLEQCTVVVVPVAALPKAALVEIRALGVLDEETLYALPQSEEEELSVEGAVCAKLGVVTIRYTQPDNVQTCDYAHVIRKGISKSQLETSVCPLALEVYILESETTDVQTLLSNNFPDAAVNVISSAWLPHNATMTCLCTFDV